MSRNPAEVPCTFVCDPSQLSDLAAELAEASRVAIDTEVPIADPRAGEMRVMSVATRRSDGTERAFVVDVRDLDPRLLAPLLNGVVADAWNATFDARVIDSAVFASTDTTSGLVWWDAQLADALIFQGRSGFSWYHGLAWATGHYLGLKAEGKGTVQLSYTAFDELTPTQISYAAADAVETLWVGDAIRDQAEAVGLGEICAIEMAARPFLDQMERTGLPFDWPGWERELHEIELQNRAAVGRLADLTGGGQGTLFDEIVEPTWNPASDQQVRQALNEWASDEVQRWTANRHGAARPLSELDSVTANVLREIGGELCHALLDYRTGAKILTTYGESIRDHLHDDGRLRPQYLQVVGTNTGRLASRNPNAQNFAPRMKPFFRPPTKDRVFVHADLSQAELRYLAQVSDDQPLRAAFARGDDVHVSTAASMFGFDAKQLAADDPKRLKHLRQIAKALNFGIAYGSGANALARSLTAEGSPTTKEEGAKLLDQYRNTYPGTAAWAQARIAEVETFREQTKVIDWAASLQLSAAFGEVAAIRRELRQTLGRWPDADEIAERHQDVPGHDHAALLERILWVLNYSAPVALTAKGRPFTFASRTLAGRRQQFNLHLDRLLLVATLDAIAAPSAEMIECRRRFEKEHGMVLHHRNTPLPEPELTKLFEDRALRRMYMESVAECVGVDAAHGHLDRAARERTSAMVNAWRNAPIQGGVADIMLAAYADLHERLRAFPTARPVQTVHDSVVVECDAHQAEQVAIAVRQSLEAASLRFCPNVAPRADVDIRSSLADADVISVAPVAPG